jgi:predicted metal-dependent phosphoesterase TrpH
LIDLHTHTTASDGRCAPAELVRRAAVAGVTILSVTDHDTVAACEAGRAACDTAGLEFVPGIEITAIRDGVDVHVLGYFVDPESPELLAFLAEQRLRRADRARQMIARLAALGMPLDADAILQPGVDNPSVSIGRPWIARALMASGHVATTGEAFDRWLSRGQPAFVPRIAATPEDVIGRIHAAGGLAAMAHPGVVERDEWIDALAAAGLDALEAFHSDHDAAATARYAAIARRLNLATTGGSDYHGDESHGPSAPGAVSLPPEEFERLKVRLAAMRATASCSDTSS